MSVTIETLFQITTTAKGKKRLGAPVPVAPPPPPPVPRVARLMALAIHFEGLIRQGIVRDYADLARLGGVSRARITQIMNLLNLPPWRQEELLFAQGREVNERGLRGREEFWEWSDN
ncbi:MAG: hypothetical protein WCK17_16845 [Verrucomicrobiota bacterium]